MSKNKLFFQALLVCLSLQAPQAVLAESDPLSVYVQAGINPTQHAQITDLAAQLEETNVARSHEIIELIKNLRTLSIQPDLDEKKILATQSRINELEGSMAIDRLKLNMKVRKLLTPEQRLKLVAILKEQRANAASTKVPSP